MIFNKMYCINLGCTYCQQPSKSRNWYLLQRHTQTDRQTQLNCYNPNTQPVRNPLSLTKSFNCQSCGHSIVFQ